MESLFAFGLTLLIMAVTMSVAWDYRAVLRKWFGM